MNGTRRLQTKELVLASHNAGKLREISALLQPFGITVTSANEHDLQEPDETEDSFAGNARIKAHFAAQKTGLPALSDDSGIEVEALDNAPGVYTADWAETENGRDFMKAMQKTWDLLEARQAKEPRRARFVCTLCLAWPDGQDEIFRGEASGHLVWPPRGAQGFGYDPMFVRDGQTLTFGEMPYTMKEPLSHRSAAFKALVEACFEQP